MVTIPPQPSDCQSEPTPRPGDWVTVLGQVVDKPTHPSDLVIELFSHNEQYACHVERGRISPAEVPALADRCAALFDKGNERLLRCMLHLDHYGDHRQGKWHWNDSATYGHVEYA